jgi:hypothetical protein
VRYGWILSCWLRVFILNPTVRSLYSKALLSLLLYFTVKFWWNMREFYLVDFVFLTSLWLRGLYTTWLSSCYCNYILLYHIGGIRENFILLTLYFNIVLTERSLYCLVFLSLLLKLLLYFSVPSWWDTNEICRVEVQIFNLNWLNTDVNIHRP